MILRRSRFLKYGLLISTLLSFLSNSVLAEDCLIRISGAYAIYPLVLRLSEEFKKERSSCRFEITAGGAGKGVADALAGLVDIGLVSRDPHPEEIEKGAIFIPIAKDAVVATFSSKNPHLKILLQKGLTREALRDIWTGKIKTWGDLLGIKDNSPINAYTRADVSGAGETWAKFLFGPQGKQEDLKGIGVLGDPGMAESVRKDPLGIGYNNLNYAYHPRTGKPIEGLYVLPIDFNGNGKIDKDENFYSSREELLSAVRDGRYPTPPARNSYFVIRGKPQGAVREFIIFSLIKGDKVILEAGYIPLSPDEKKTALSKLE